MLIFEATDVLKALSMEVCIPLMADAIRDLATGKSQQPLRSLSVLPDGNIFGFMPAYLGTDDFFGAKIATAFHTNEGTPYPSHMGYVMLLESRHGSVCALADANTITQIRTGAVSGVATQLLAREDAHRLALIGAGAQAAAHLKAMRCVRDIQSVAVYDPIPGRAEAFAESSEKEYRIHFDVCHSVREAARDADIICTVTSCKTPILSLSDVKPGAHINAVGAYTKTTREISTDLVAASRLYADAMDSIKSEGGEFLIAKQEGAIDDGHIVGDLGGLLLGSVPGRQSATEITLFDAHGLAVEDVACAKYLYLKATNTKG